MSVFFDTHAHLDDPRFAADIEAVLNRAATADIQRVICIGTDLDSSRAVLALTERFANVFAAIGWHPSYVTAAPEDVRPELRELAKHPKVVAIGETGLDYYRLPSSQGASPQEDEHYKRRQFDLFQQQLQLAEELQLNCVIHQRESLHETLRALQPFAGRVRPVFHCFSADTDALNQVLDLGGFVSFTGIVTFKNAHSARQAVAAVPPDRFMLETDCPYLAPVPFRGARCEPAHVREIAALVASVRNCTLDELSAQTCQNAFNFFKGLR